jgi:lysyl-tRNA synthetase class 2
MSSSLQTFSNSLLSTRCHGRVLEVICPNEKLAEAISENNRNILVLIEDKLYSLDYQGNAELSAGSLISFEIGEKGEVVKLKTVGSSVNFESEGDLLRWRRPAINPSRMKRIRTRQQIMNGIREWFELQDFIETETPSLVTAPSPESQFSPIKTDTGFLITSPEFQMKRLLAGGFEKIYQLARCFRKGESGPLHNPEFTMLEWYRSNETLEVLMSDIEQLVVYLSKTITAENFAEKIPLPPWTRVTVSSLFKKHLDVILDGTESASQLREKAQLSGHDELLVDLSVKPDLTESLAYEQIFFRLWNHIETEFAGSTPVFVYEWPLPLASLARPCPQRSGFAERVELYVSGMELANGFGELTDAAEQRRRFEQDLKNRHSERRGSVPLDGKFLKSLEQGLPECSGMALGVDRLIMWLCGAKQIREVLCFSVDEI